MGKPTRPEDFVRVSTIGKLYVLEAWQSDIEDWWPVSDLREFGTAMIELQAMQTTILAACELAVEADREKTGPTWERVAELLTELHVSARAEMAIARALGFDFHGCESIIPLRKFLSAAYQASTVDEVAERFKPGESSVVLAALRTAAESFGDVEADRKARPVRSE